LHVPTLLKLTQMIISLQPLLKYHKHEASITD
jgi:hypothetical protein